jgi:hypothetical protein
VRLRCRGGRTRGCLFRTKTKQSNRSRTIRFREIERRLRAGVILEISVRRGETIGKFTSFRIRRLKPPVRKDACLAPGRSGPTECPE